MWSYNYTFYSNELYHHGIKGMRWGVRKARQANKKVDKGFNDWKENDKLKNAAIAAGKKATASKMAYEKDKSNKQLRGEYKKNSQEYKKALKQNTTFRKGTVKNEVGKDASRKYLSEAKKIKKQLDADPTNSQLKSKYNDLMNKHDVERAKARRAPVVAEKRMRKKASIKRTLTMSAKAAAGTAAVSVGVVAANAYLTKHNVLLDGNPLRVKKENVDNVIKFAKIGKDLMGYIH